MAGYFGKDGVEAAIDRDIQAFSGTLHLYTNHITDLDQHKVLADFTEATFSEYAPVDIAVDDWGDPTWDEDSAFWTSLSGLYTFGPWTPTSGGQVWGWYWLDDDGNLVAYGDFTGGSYSFNDTTPVLVVQIQVYVQSF